MRILYQRFRGLTMGFKFLVISFVALTLVGFGTWMIEVGASFGLPHLTLILVLVGLFVGIRWLLRRYEARLGGSLADAMWKRVSQSGKEDFESGEAARSALLAQWQGVFERLGKDGLNLYSLPWVLIVGPSQSGKSTLIQKSGLEFIGGNKPVKDGGTRGCKFYFPSRGVLIDTAGVYVDHRQMTEDDNSEGLVDARKEWAEFLTLLQRHRPGSPINALILTLRVPDLLEPDPVKRESTAAVVRGALQDIEEQLHCRVPVYIMVSMCDQVVGFVDFFKHLPGLSDNTLLGWSRAGDTYAEPTAEETRIGLGAIVDSLREMRTHFLNRQVDRDASGAAPQENAIDRLYSFPEEFDTLTARVQEATERIFTKTPRFDQHLLRGIYFTSAEQKGQPVLSACLEWLGEGKKSVGTADVQGLISEEKSYFIKDFFVEKVFKEAGLVVSTRSHAKKKKWKERALVGAGVVVLAAFVLGIWSGKSVLEEVAETPLQTLRNTNDVFQKGGASLGSRCESLLALQTQIDHLRENPRWFLGERIDQMASRLEERSNAIFIDQVFFWLVGKKLTSVSNVGATSNWPAALATGNAYGDLLDIHADTNRWTSMTDEGLTNELVGLCVDLASGDNASEVVVGRMEDLATDWVESSIRNNSKESLVDDIKRRIVAEGQLYKNLVKGLQQAGDHWIQWHEGMSKRPEAMSAPAAKSRTEKDQAAAVRSAWQLERLLNLDRQARDLCRSLKKSTLDAVALEAKLPDYERKVRKPYSTRHDRLKKILKELQGDLKPGALDDIDIDLAYDWRIVELQRLHGIATTLGDGFQGAQKIGELLTSLQDAKKEYRTWYDEALAKGEGEGSQSFLSIQEGEAKEGERIRLTVKSRVSSAILDACAELVALDPRKEYPYDSPAFRKLADEKVFAERIATLGDVSEALESQPIAVREMVQACNIDGLKGKLRARTAAAILTWVSELKVDPEIGSKRLPGEIIEERLKAAGEKGPGFPFARLGLITRLQLSLESQGGLCGEWLVEKDIRTALRGLGTDYAKASNRYWASAFEVGCKKETSWKEALEVTSPWQSFAGLVKQMVRLAQDQEKQYKGTDEASDLFMRLGGETGPYAETLLVWRCATNYGKEINALAAGVSKSVNKLRKEKGEELLETANEQDALRPIELGSKHELIDQQLERCVAHLRVALGTIATEQFNSVWQKMGEKWKSRLKDHFPFTVSLEALDYDKTMGTNLSEFFRDSAFQSLQKTVWPQLRMMPERRIFTVAPSRQVTCFMRCSRMADWLGYAADVPSVSILICPQFHGVADPDTGGHTAWRWRVSHADPQGIWSTDSSPTEVKLSSRESSLSSRWNVKSWAVKRGIRTRLTVSPHTWSRSLRGIDKIADSVPLFGMPNDLELLIYLKAFSLSNRHYKRDHYRVVPDGSEDILRIYHPKDETWSRELDKKNLNANERLKKIRLLPNYRDWKVQFQPALPDQLPDIDKNSGW